MSSSVINESESIDVSESKKATFGKSLLQARERNGYTLAEAAKATHLDESIIDALEQSDMNRLPPPAFVQGYLRTYARFLELPEEEIVDGFNHAVPYKRVSQLHPRAVTAPQADLKSPWVRGILIALSFLVLVALMYSGFRYFSHMIKRIHRETATKVSLRPEEQNSVNEHVLQSTESDTGLKKPVPSTHSVVSQAGNTVSSSTTSAPANTGTDVLNLTASADSWVEITDATGRSLYHDLFRKGQTMQLKGKAPFDVFLGNAPAINLSVNGAKVKMDGRIRSDKVAHFTVTTSEGNVVFR